MYVIVSGRRARKRGMGERRGESVSLLINEQTKSTVIFSWLHCKIAFTILNCSKMTK